MSQDNLEHLERLAKLSTYYHTRCVSRAEEVYFRVLFAQLELHEDHVTEILNHNGLTHARAIQLEHDVRRILLG